MLTKNGKKLLRYIMQRCVEKTFNTESTYSELTETFKDINGELIAYKLLSLVANFPDHRSNIFYPRTSATINTYGLYFGSDNTQPTEDDYTITPIGNATISITSARAYNDENDNQYYEMVLTYMNRYAYDITICEFGCFMYSGGKFFLIYRDVLDSPITVAAGETKSIKITINMDW